MKPSDILQEAADKGVRQTFGRYYNDRKTAFCGLGVIRNKLGVCDYNLTTEEFNTKIREYWKFLTPQGSATTVEYDIMNWNDKDKLSFGEIAQLLKERYNL